jgi:hypothetical protein
MLLHVLFQKLGLDGLLRNGLASSKPFFGCNFLHMIGFHKAISFFLAEEMFAEFPPILLIQHYLYTLMFDPIESYAKSRPLAFFFTTSTTLQEVKKWLLAAQRVSLTSCLCCALSGVYQLLQLRRRR